MSAWQRWQASDFMKYCEGMLPPCLVCAELGKNFPCGPSPSLSMVSGGMCGLEMWFAFFQVISRVHHAPAEIPAVRSSSATNPNPRCAKPWPIQPRDASQDASKNNAPKRHSEMCAYSQDLK